MDSTKPDYYVPNIPKVKSTIENILENITSRILTRVETLLEVTEDTEKMDALLEKAFRVLELYARIKGL